MVKTVESLYVVLRIVDTEKFSQMDYVYPKISASIEEIIVIVG